MGGWTQAWETWWAHGDWPPMSLGWRDWPSTDGPLLPCTWEIAVFVACCYAIVRGRSMRPPFDPLPPHDVPPEAVVRGRRVSDRQLAAFRAFAAAIVFANAYAIFFKGDPNAHTPGEPSLTGQSSIKTYSFLSWLAIGLYFVSTFAASVAFLAGFGAPPPWLASTLWIASGTLTAIALYVTTAVWFILAPAMFFFQSWATLASFFKPTALILHDFNVLLLLGELLLTGPAYRPTMAVCPVALLCGFVYWAFAVWWHGRTDEWIYFLFDWSIPFIVLKYAFLTAKTILCSWLAVKCGECIHGLPSKSVQMI